MKEAEEYLTTFLVNFKDIYGNEHLTLNFHYLTHLVDLVRNHGPLWTVTCFPFESYNNIFTSFINGTNKIEMHAAESFSLTRELKQRISKEQNPTLIKVMDKRKVSTMSFKIIHIFNLF